MTSSWSRRSGVREILWARWCRRWWSAPYVTLFLMLIPLVFGVPSGSLALLYPALTFCLAATRDRDADLHRGGDPAHSWACS